MSMIYDVRHSQFSARVAYVMFFHAANRPVHRTPGLNVQQSRSIRSPILHTYFRLFSIAQSRMWTFYFSSSKSLEKNFKNSQHFRCYGEISRSSPFLLYSYRSMDLIVDRKRRKSTKEERKKKNKESIDTDDRAWPRFCFRLYSKGGKGEFSQGKAELNVTGSE